MINIDPQSESILLKDTEDSHEYERIKTPNEKMKFLGEKIKEIEKDLFKIDHKRRKLLQKKETFIIELKNLIERLTIMVENEVITESDIPDPYNPNRVSRKKNNETQFLQIDDFREAKKYFEKEYIMKKLLDYENNITKTAKSIGVTRSYLHKKLKEMK